MEDAARIVAATGDRRYGESRSQIEDVRPMGRRNPRRAHQDCCGHTETRPHADGGKEGTAAWRVFEDDQERSAVHGNGGAAPDEDRYRSQAGGRCTRAASATGLGHALRADQAAEGDLRASGIVWRYSSEDDAR